MREKWVYNFYMGSAELEFDILDHPDLMRGLKGNHASKIVTVFTLDQQAMLKGLDDLILKIEEEKTPITSIVTEFDRKQNESIHDLTTLPPNNT